MNTRLLTTTVLLFVFNMSIGQELPTYAPVSPNAASLGKFGAFPVNANLGTTNISIPLYTIKQGDIEIPISLSYNATSGIRVNEEASWVGLGWTLNAGGAIVRNVKGQPDTMDIPDTDTLAFDQNSYDYLLDVAKGFADTSQDEYLFNYSGNSGKFYYDQNKSDFVFSDYKPIKISPTGGGVTAGRSYSFDAILANGTQLEFYEHEKTDKEAWANSGVAPYYREYTSASYLTKVISANKTDSVTLEYNDNIIEKSPERIGDYVTNPPTPPSTVIAISSSSNYYKSYEKVLSRINFKNGYVLFDYSLDRLDSDSPKLNHIKVYSSINSVDSLIKQITFNYDYYNRSGGGNYHNQFNSEKSLKLTHIDVYANNTAPQIYSFEYNSGTLPLRMSAGQDFWGYANNNTGSYLHKRDVRVYTKYNPGAVWFWEGNIQWFTREIGTGDRSADENKTKAGILTKITYPTGGYTEFEYEANKYESTVSIPTYTHHSRSIISEGTGGLGACDTGLKTLSFSPTTTPYNAKLAITFTDALGGNGNQSYGKFDGQSYFRNPPTTLYPYTTHNVDITLNHNNNYTIEAMEYGDGAPGASGCPFVSVMVTWDELSGTTNQVVENLVGGLRIKSITNYDGVNIAFTSKKEFEYGTLKQLIPIIDEDYQTLKGLVYLYNTYSSSLGYALNINGGPSVEYFDVTEFNYDTNNNNNGKIVYEYEPTPSDRIISDGSPGSGSVFKMFVHPNYYGANCNGAQMPPIEPPIFSTLKTYGFGNFSNYYTQSWASGSLKKLEHHKRNTDNSYTLIKSTEHAYNKVDETTLHMNYVSDVQPWAEQNGQGGFSDPCSFYNGFFMYNKGFYSFGKKLLTSTIEKSYDQDGLNPVETVKDYSYNDNYFLSEIYTTKSNGDKYISKNYYPDDVTTTISIDNDALTTPEKAAIDRLKKDDLHHIGEAIQTSSYVDKNNDGVADSNELINVQRTNYFNWGNDLVLPIDIQTLKGEYNVSTNTLKDRIVFHDYYANGNLKEVSKKDGTTIVYIWGYDEQYPIAKIENATYLQIEAAIATLPSSYNTLAEIQAKSNADNDNTKEGELRTVLQAIRDHSSLSNTMVTTYTFDPLIGITSVTDPRGYTTYYEYDEANRLKHVKDGVGNILSKNEYHYKSQ
ncbi:MAG: RHS repeat protein [Bacteroidota bacterium]